jgi:allantoinase
MKRRSKNPGEPAHHDSRLELLIRGGEVVTVHGIQRLDVGVREGRIVQLRGSIADDADEVVDASGQLVFPGIIDAHVHFNEPGREEWEGLAFGPAALAAGGGTTFFDMPLNSEPPVLDAAALRAKRALGEEKSCVDFALWGGLVPGNLDRLAGLRDAGAIGLKAFMCDSGIASFPRIDPASLRAGMQRAAKLGMLVAVHAEDQPALDRAMAKRTAASPRTPRAYLASRPIEAELAAIRMALEFAGETGCALHVVHVSSPEGIALIEEARSQRVDVSAETCPHYLLLNEMDVVKHGAVAKCAPPLRDEKRRLALWEDLRAGRIQTVGSDHSPAPAELKQGRDFFAIWGGIAGVQHGFPLLLSECAATRDRDLPRLAAVLAGNVARRFRIDERKGGIAEGKDADFCVVRFGPKRVIAESDLWTRHRLSPYVGRTSRVQVEQTFVRGRRVWGDGRVAPAGVTGSFLRPTP